MPSFLRLILLGAVITILSGCAKDPASGHYPIVSSYHSFHSFFYLIYFLCNSVLFAISLYLDVSDARFVLPDNPGIWIKDPGQKTTSVKLSTTTLHIHRERWAHADMTLSNFWIESSKPEIIVRVDHGANGRVVIRSDCDAITTQGEASQTFKLKLCRQ